MAISRSRTWPPLVRSPSCSYSLVTHARRPFTAVTVGSDSSQVRVHLVGGDDLAREDLYLLAVGARMIKRDREQMIGEVSARMPESDHELNRINRLANSPEPVRSSHLRRRAK